MGWQSRLGKLGASALGGIAGSALGPGGTIAGFFGGGAAANFLRGTRSTGSAYRRASGAYNKSAPASMKTWMTNHPKTMGVGKSIMRHPYIYGGLAAGAAIGGSRRPDKRWANGKSVGRVYGHDYSSGVQGLVANSIGGSTYV